MRLGQSGKGEGAGLRVVAHPVVDENERGHRFDDGDCPGEDAGIVAALSLELRGRAGVVHGGLCFHHRGSGFEGHPEVDVFSVGNAALDAARAVGLGADPAVLIDEEIIVLDSGQVSTRKTAADFESFGGREGEHGFGEIGFESVENGGTQSGGNVAEHTTDGATDAISFTAHGADAFDHAFGGGGIGAADGVRLDRPGFGEGHLVGDGDVLNALNIGEDFNARSEAKDFFGDGPGGDSSDRLAGAGAAAPFSHAASILGIVGKVGVAGSVGLFHFVVGPGSVILVAHVHSNGGAKGVAGVDPTEDDHFVRLVAGCGDIALSGASSIEFALDVFGGQGKSGGTPIHHHSNAAPVALAPCRQAEKAAERITHSSFSQGHGARRSKSKKWEKRFPRDRMLKQIASMEV